MNNFKQTSVYTTHTHTYFFIIFEQETDIAAHYISQINVGLMLRKITRRVYKSMQDL